MRADFRIVMVASALIMVVLSGSCKKYINTEIQLIKYIDNPKNKLNIIQEVGKVETSLSYKPWQLMALNEPKNKGITDTSTLKDLKRKYFFVLSLSANHKELLRQLKFSDYSEMVQVMAFRMMDYVSAVPDNGKAVAPEACFFQQTYGAGQANQLLIVFNKSTLERSKQVEIKINEFGLNIGNLNYRFKLQDIIDLQNIALNN